MKSIGRLSGRLYSLLVINCKDFIRVFIDGLIFGFIKIVDVSFRKVGGAGGVS